MADSDSVEKAYAKMDDDWVKALASDAPIELPAPRSDRGRRPAPKPPAPLVQHEQEPAVIDVGEGI